MQHSIVREFDSTWITLKNDLGLEVVLCARGASIYSARLNGMPLMVSPKDKPYFLGKNGPFYGKTISPFAGRCREGVIEYGSKKVVLPDGPNHISLHSETENAAFLEFLPAVEELKEGILCHFMAMGRDLLDVTYLLRRDSNALAVTLKARNDKELRPFNMTNHSYWNLGAENDVLDHELRMKCKGAVVYHDDLIPERFVPASGPFDFSSPKAVGKDVDLLTKENTDGYDNYFLFEESDYETPKLTLSSKKASMEILTDAPGVQIYGMNFPEDIDLENGNHEAYRCALALEPASIPNPLEGFHLTEPGETFVRHFEYRFQAK